MKPSIDIDNTDSLVDGDMTLTLNIDDRSVSGAVGPWDAEKGRLQFGLDCDIQIRREWDYANDSGDRVEATVQVGGIQSHGSDVAWQRIEGYTVATRLIEVAEGMPYDLYDDIADAIVDSVNDMNIRGLRLLDFRNVIAARKATA